MLRYKSIFVNKDKISSFACFRFCSTSSSTSSNVNNNNNNNNFISLLHFTDSAKQFLRANNLDTIEKIKNTPESDVNKTIVLSMVNNINNNHNNTNEHHHHHHHHQQQQQQYSDAEESLFDEFDKKIFDLFHSILRLSPEDQKNVLFVACERKQPMTIRAAIAAGVDVNAREDVAENQQQQQQQQQQNRTALFVACLNGHLDCVKTLIELGADVDLPCKGGWNPLHIACEQGHVEIAELLVKVGADANRARADGVKPIHILAHQKKHFDADNNDNNNNNNNNNNNIDSSSSTSSYRSLIRTLIEKGKADPNATYMDGEDISALYIAAKQGNAQFIKELIFVCLHRPVPVPLNLLHRRKTTGATAFFAAVEEHNSSAVISAFLDASPPNMIKLLLESEDEIHKATPFAMAVMKNNAEVVKTILSSRKIDPIVLNFIKNKPDIVHGATPLFAACQFNYPEMVEVLLKEGKCDPNIPLVSKNSSKTTITTPLVIAVSEKNLQVAHLLLKYGEHTSLKETNPVIREDGATLIFLAAQNNDPDMVELLCEYADTKVKEQAGLATESGLTPMSVAVHNGYKQVVRVLLRFGVSIKWELGQFKSLSQLALHKGHSEIFQMLAHHDKTPEQQAKEKTEEQKRRDKKMWHVSEDDFKKHFKKL